MKLIESIIKLSNYNAPSGSEYLISEDIKEIFEQYCDEVFIDKFYNVVGKINGNHENCKDVMMTAHYDEVSLIVSGYADNGFLRFSALGGIDEKIILAQEVIVHGKENIFGVIGATPPHLLDRESQNKIIKIVDMFIDTGYSDERLKEIVNIGDVITFRRNAVELINSQITGKALDNRCGVVCLITTMKKLSKTKSKNNIFFIATVQEEYTMIGAAISSFNIKPDMAIVTDVTFGKSKGVSGHNVCDVGKGVPISIGPILSKKHSDRLINIAKEKGIKHCVVVENGNTGTEAMVTQIANDGVPSVLLNVPLKYMHSTVETVCSKDIKAAANLAATFIKKL